jgi:hypothetical protein
MIWWRCAHVSTGCDVGRTQSGRGALPDDDAMPLDQGEKNWRLQESEGATMTTAGSAMQRLTCAATRVVLDSQPAWAMTSFRLYPNVERKVMYKTLGPFGRHGRMRECRQLVLNIGDAQQLGCGRRSDLFMNKWRICQGSS